MSCLDVEFCVLRVLLSDAVMCSKTSVFRQHCCVRDGEMRTVKHELVMQCGVAVLAFSRSPYTFVRSFATNA